MYEEENQSEHMSYLSPQVQQLTPKPSGFVEQIFITSQMLWA